MLGGTLVFIFCLRYLAYYSSPEKNGFTLTGWDYALIALTVFAMLVTPVWKWWARRRVRRLYDQQKGLREQFTADFSVEGVHTRTATGESRQPWDYFHKWISADDMVLLFESDALMQILPRRAFATQADYDALRDLLTRRLGPAK